MPRRPAGSKVAVVGFPGGAATGAGCAGRERPVNGPDRFAGMLASGVGGGYSRDMSDVTRLLEAAAAGRPQAAAELLPLVYDELRKLAAARMAAERADHTLNPTALVHEAYLRLVGGDTPQDWSGRGHFFGSAAEAMRRILLDRARHKQTHDTGGRSTAVLYSLVGTCRRLGLDPLVYRRDVFARRPVIPTNAMDALLTGSAVDRLPDYSERPCGPPTRLNFFSSRAARDSVLTHE
jgi:hypothetical protein